MSIWGNEKNKDAAVPKGGVPDQDDSLIESVLGDFEEKFGPQPIQSKQSQHQEVIPTTTNTAKSLEPARTVFTDTHTKQPEPPVDVARKRLERIEQRIVELDEKKPEYIEERIALEKKRSLISKEQRGDSIVSIIQNTGSTQKSPTSEKDEQIKAVEDLLNKKMFSYIAPIPSPKEEEQVRTKKAQEAAEVDSGITQNPQNVLAPENIDSSPDARYTKAAEIREAFLNTLIQTPKVDWYKNPSKNRDHVNQQVILLAELLSGKKTTDIDMNDIQTARLFLFNNAPAGILEHPAFSYVESFYDYQNNQGYSGKDMSGIKVTTPNTVESPYMSAQPKKIEEGAVQSPITSIGTQNKPGIVSPFINLNNTKKQDDDDSEFSI